MITTQAKDRKEYSGRQAPWYLTKMIQTIGGQTMFGEPNFRLVWGPDRLTPSGGTWVDWPTGSSTKDRRTDRAKPLRRVTEVRMIKRYGPAQIWCLEKWCPPSLYGHPGRWYSPAIIGGTMILSSNGLDRIPSQGSYPARGDYEYTGFGYTESELSEAQVIGGMQQIIRGIEELPRSPYARLWERTMIAQQAQTMVDDNFEKWALDVIQDVQPAMGGQPMTGYGKKGPSSTEIVARRLGFKEQV